MRSIQTDFYTNDSILYLQSNIVDLPPLTTYAQHLFARCIHFQVSSLATIILLPTFLNKSYTLKLIDQFQSRRVSFPPDFGHSSCIMYWQD